MYEFIYSHSQYFVVYWRTENPAKLLGLFILLVYATFPLGGNTQMSKSASKLRVFYQIQPLSWQKNAKEYEIWKEIIHKTLVNGSEMMYICKMNCQLKIVNYAKEEYRNAS